MPPDAVTTPYESEAFQVSGVLRDRRRRLRRSRSIRLSRRSNSRTFSHSQATKRMISLTSSMISQANEQIDLADEVPSVPTPSRFGAADPTRV